MKHFSFKKLNICACMFFVLMVCAVPILGVFHIEWGCYVLLFLGAVSFFILFFLYQKKVSEYFDMVDNGMDQMLSNQERIELPEVDDTESVFSRFNSKLLRLYEALRISEDKAEMEKQAMQGMIADLSHQIKTPVANIKMDLEVLKSRDMSKGKQMEFLERTIHQTDKMDFLIKSIIKMSRLESGAIQIIPKMQDFTLTLANALLSVSSLAEQKDIEIIVECPQPFMIKHDAKWTEEAVFNLLENAVKYTPEHGKIKVYGEVREIGAYLSIVDNGRGISEELQGAIFTKFFRAPDVHNMPGAGVGLYLTRKIIEAQEGYVTVSSMIGQGSTFTIQFL